MRTEDIVGLIFFSLLLLGVGFILAGGNRARPQLRKPKRTVAGLAIVGLAFLSFGLLSSYFVHKSPRIEAIGYIENLRQTLGKNAGSRFFLAVNGGPTFSLHARYHDYGIQQGELAKVRFSQYSNSVLDLTMLSGPTQGWQLTESDGSTTYWLLAVVGLVFSLGALHQHRNLADRA